MVLNKLKKPLSILALVSSVLIITVTVFAKTDSDVSREYHLKAAFLRYVAMFVTWPTEATSQTANNICLLGDVPDLEGMNSINGRMVNDKPIVVRPVASLDVAKKDCQILFISRSEEKNLGNIIEQTKGLPILTFGDMEGFAESGGDMNFYIVNNRMAIMINQESVAASKLTIAPRMLRLVTIVPNVDETTEPQAQKKAG